MKLKKLIALGLATVMSASMLVGCGAKSDSNASTDNGDKVFKVGMITDTGGVNDESFNQSTWKGFQDAQEKFGKDKLEIKYLESKQDADYVQNIDTFADEGMDLIVGVGFKLQSAITEAAKNYPDQQFALIDAVCEGEQLENVTSLLFEDNASAYLTGLIAGRMTETNKVGFIGGMESPVISKFDYGFRAGVKAANPDAEVMVQYANSFTDSALGKTIANQMHSKNADIIFTCAGAVGIGAIEAAKENGKYAIGVDRDQSDLAPENVLTSAIKRVDAGVFETVKSYVNGTFEGGTTTTYGLEENAVGVPDTTKNLVSQEILDLVEETITKLKNKEITVPKNEEEYNAMVK